MITRKKRGEKRNWVVTYFIDGEPLSPQWIDYSIYRPTRWARKNLPMQGATFEITEEGNARKKDE